MEAVQEARWHETCLICGSRRLEPLDDYASAHLARCVECGFVFAQRRPTDDELESYYNRYGSGWHDSPLTRQRYRELLDGMEPYRQNNRILDVGCGAGFFLEEARARGWQVHGSEFGAHALEINREKGIDVVAGPLAPDSFDASSFDVITAFEVFEHLREPATEASIIAAFLREDGLLYCTTPNFDSATRRLLGDRWRVVCYPEHLCYFTSETLTSWLARAGFKRVSVRSSGFTVAGIRERLRSGGDGEAVNVAANTEQLRTTIESSGTLRVAKAIVNSTLSLARAGDTLKARFERVRSSSTGGLSVGMRSAG